MQLVSQEIRKRAAAIPLELKIDDGTGWHLLGDKSLWTEKERVINPPNERNSHRRAFYTKINEEPIGRTYSVPIGWQSSKIHDSRRTVDAPIPQRLLLYCLARVELPSRRWPPAVD
jgi:hypothetical protein